MDMEIIDFRFVGSSPLLVQSERLVNPMDPIRKEIAKLTKKGRNKTDADHAEIMRLEFEAHLYHDANLGPVMPGQNIEACLRGAATQIKLGRAVQRGLMVVNDKVRIDYDGPRAVDGLFADMAFVDCRSVVLAGKRTMRTRPIFREWSLSFEVAFEPNQLDRAQVLDIAQRAGRYVGIGTYRPRFGRFSTEASNG